MTPQETALAEAFYRFGLPESAAAFLLKVWTATQFLDDVQDGDTPDKSAIYTMMVGLPTDPFLAAHREPLALVLATCYLKWQAANAAESSGAASAKSYMWRACYYDLILAVCALCLPNPEAVAPEVMALYGETFEDYQKEFANG